MSDKEKNAVLYYLLTESNFSDYLDVDDGKHDRAQADIDDFWQSSPVNTGGQFGMDITIEATADAGLVH